MCKYDKEYFDSIDFSTDPRTWPECKHWRLGDCYLCRYYHAATEQEWYKRGCETWCNGGCKEFKRDWRLTLRWLFRKEVKHRHED